jgi:hypothetical protein
MVGELLLRHVLLLLLLLTLRIRLLGLLLLLVYSPILKTWSTSTGLRLLLILRWLAWARPRPWSCGRRLATRCRFHCTSPRP